MAKKNKALEANVGESKWDGRLLTLIGTSLLQLLVIVIMAAIGAVIAYAIGAFNEDADTLIFILGLVILFVFVLVGICWSNIIFIKWDTKHTVISGQRLKFKAGTLNLFFNCIKWFVLTVITLGIYGLWMYVKVRKWMAKHTVSYPEEKEEVADPSQPQVTYYTVEN